LIAAESVVCKLFARCVSSVWACISTPVFVGLAGKAGGGQDCQRKFDIDVSSSKETDDASTLLSPSFQSTMVGGHSDRVDVDVKGQQGHGGPSVATLSAKAGPRRQAGPAAAAQSNPVHPPTGSSSSPATSSSSNKQRQPQPREVSPPVPTGYDEARYSDKRKAWFFMNRRSRKTRWATDAELSIATGTGWTARFSDSKKRW
jgi:hypothetical protein